MKKILLPDWLYQLLPYFYAGVGFLTIVILRSGMAIFSGLTLVSAGVAVWMLRYRYRHGIGTDRGGLSDVEFADADRVSDSAVHIAWRQTYETGNPGVDSQHRKLFGLGNLLIGAVRSNQPQPEIQWAIDVLIEHIKAHFHAEEASPTWMTRPKCKEHQEIHYSLIAKADKIRNRSYGETEAAGDLLRYIANDVIVDHVSKEVLQTSA